MIHSTVIIDPSAKIGKNVSVGPYAVIGADVTIGDGCQIAGQVFIEHTELGENCRIFPFATIGTDPQHMKYKGEKTKLTVGPRCVFREGTSMHRGTMLDKGVTTIGSDCYFMAQSHVAHDCQLGNNVTMVNNSVLGGHVKVGNNVFISAFAAVHQFCRIGDGSMLAGGAIVVQDMAPYCTAHGDHAEIYGLNVVGLRRMGLKKENIKAVKDAYRVMFESKMLVAEALASVDKNNLDPYAKNFFDFFQDAKRGFVRPVKNAIQKEETTSV